MDKYTFTINSNPCNPSYSEDLSKELTLENNEFFYTQSLSGQLSFKGADYDYIMSMPFNTQFDVNIYLNGNLYFSGYFTRTDCDENYDDKVVVVGLTANNSYDDIVNNLDKEYNIIELLPVLQRVQINRRPIIQFYVTNSNVLTCFLGGNSWEQTVNSPVSSHSALIDTYRFGRIIEISEVVIKRLTGTVNNPQLYGTWTKVGSGFIYELEGLPGYFMRRDPFDESHDYLRIYRESDSRNLYNSNEFPNGSAVIPPIYFEPVSGSGATGELAGEGFNSGVYARLMLGGDPNDGSTVYNAPSNDIIPANKNYPNIQPYTSLNVSLSTTESMTPTEFGKNNKGNYFAAPAGHATNRYYPVARDRWINTSYWYLPGSGYATLDTNKSIPYIMSDAYDLVSVLNLLLKQIDSKYSFTEEGSKFFYGGNTIPPMSVNSNNRRIFFTQKTNILKSRYDTSAQKAMVSLKSLLDMLYATHRVKWHMDGNNLCIEHIAYYLRGHSYYNQQIGLDMSLWNHPKHYKRYNYGQNKRTYDKSDLFKFIQFEYSEKVTDAFNGVQIEAYGAYVQKGKTDKPSVSTYNPDIDLMLANPTEFSNDGFALFAVVDNSGGATVAPWVLPYFTIKYQNTNYIIQNGSLSFFYLAPRYYVFDAPSERIYLNGSLTAVGTVKQTKLMGKQQVWLINTYSNLYTDPQAHLLVRVDANKVGLIEKMSINLTTRKIELNLRYGLLDF